MLKSVARVGDQVRGHLDVEGNEIIGSITSGSPNCNNGSLSIATSNGIITIPTHPHQLDMLGNPTDFRSHTWRIVGSAKNKANGEFIARDGDGVLS